MRGFGAITFCLAIAIFFASQNAEAQPDERLSAVRSFSFALGDPLQAGLVSRFGGFDLVIVDGELASAEQISALQAQGVLVLGYLSVGTIEKGRGWFRRSRRFRLELWADWGEWYADVSASGYRRIIAGVVAPQLLDKGFDGIFLDNLDMVLSHRALRRPMFSLLKKLSRLARGQTRLLFAQNGDELLIKYAPYLDGWNREDVSSTYDFDTKNYVASSESEQRQALGALQIAVNLGLLALSTDYVAQAGSLEEQRAITAACTVGAVPYASDIELTRIPQTPFTCE